MTGCSGPPVGWRRQREGAARDEVDHHHRLEDVEHEPEVPDGPERVPVELVGVPVRGEQQRPGEDEVAPHDPAQADPVALARRVEEERRPEDVAGPDERHRVAWMDVPRERARHEVREEQHPDREPGRRSGPQQTPGDLAPRWSLSFHGTPTRSCSTARGRRVRRTPSRVDGSGGSMTGRRAVVDGCPIGRQAMRAPGLGIGSLLRLPGMVFPDSRRSVEQT